MAFKRENFSPAFISGTKTIRLFVYANEDDLLDEIMAPGYFNSQRIMMHKNSMIDVIAKDHIARLIVDKQEGLNVKIRDEHFRATDPYAELKKGRARKKAEVGSEASASGAVTFVKTG